MYQIKTLGMFWPKIEALSLNDQKDTNMSRFVARKSGAGQIDP